MEAAMGATARSNAYLRGLETANIDINYELQISNQNNNNNNRQPQYIPQQNRQPYYPPQQQNPQYGHPSQYQQPRASTMTYGARPQMRTRRNSNTSISTTTTSVNKFMKKQWGKLGGGGGGGGGSSRANSVKNFRSDHDDKDDAIDADLDNEISFDDLKHIRNTEIGSFGLNDSTPYIPTVMTNLNAKTTSAEQYRKVQMANKKSNAMNIARQQQQQQKQQQMGPRAMSLQNNYQQRPGQHPPLPQMYPQQYPPQQGYPPQGPPMQFQQGPPPQGMYQPQPQQFQQGPMYPPQAQPYMPNPRSMSLQSVNGASFQQQQRSMPYGNRPNYQGEPLYPQQQRQQLPSPPQSSQQIPPSQQRYKQDFTSSSSLSLASQPPPPPQQQLPPPPQSQESLTEQSISSQQEFSKHQAQQQLQPSEIPVLHPQDAAPSESSPPLLKTKSCNKIDFSSLNDYDDEGISVEVQPTIPIKTSSPPVMPMNSSSPQRKSRAPIESVVTFDSYNEVEESQMRNKMYDLKNNSTQQTVFYSATEFPLNSHDTMNNLSKPQLTGIKEESQNSTPVPSPSLTERPTLAKLNNKTSVDNINELNNSLDKLALKYSPVVDNNTFENNYGTYGEDEGNDTQTNANDTVRFSTITLGSTKPLNISTNKDNGESKDIIRGSILSQSTVSPIRSHINMDLSLKSTDSTPLKDLKSSSSSSPTKQISSSLSGSSKSMLLSSPLKPRSEPRTPMSTANSSHGSNSIFSPAECGLINDNSILLKELELVTTELASSVSREIKLEENLRKKKNAVDDNGMDNVNDTITDSVDFTDLNVDIDTSSTHSSTIATLAKQLNDERRKRYLIEEILIQAQQNSDSTIDLNQIVIEKEKNINLNLKLTNLTESLKLQKVEKEMLQIENQSLRLEIIELKRKYGADN